MRTLLEMKASQCRWPVDEIDGKHLFCARTRCAGSSYCLAHYERSLKRNEEVSISGKNDNGSVEAGCRV
jgi:hypothetical protein